MVMFICDICGKQFKTTQHLNQHKNRKKTCVNVNAGSSNNVILEEGNKSINKYNSIDELILYEDKSNMTYNDVIVFLNTYKNIQEFIKDREFILKNKNEIINLREENAKFKKQLEIINNTIKNETTEQSSSQPTEIHWVKPTKRSIILTPT